MNVENVNALIAHLEKQPEERFNMGYSQFLRHPCNSAACIAGHIWEHFGELLDEYLDVEDGPWIIELIMPVGWHNDRKGNRRYPLSRAIATLKRLRDHYLATGEVKVDWGPEPGAEPKRPWAAPVVSGGLPASITSVLNGGRLSLTVDAEAVSP